MGSLSGKGWDADALNRLKNLLKDQESFPIVYLHKIIGRKTPKFEGGLQALEKQFSALERVSERESAAGKHLAVTYHLSAGTPEDVIQLVQATQLLDDLVIVL